MNGRMLMGAGTSLALAAATVAQPVQTVVYGDPTDAATPLTRSIEASGFGSEAVHAAIGGDLARLAVSAHPSADQLAMASEESDGTLRVRIRADGAWGVDATVTSNAGGGDARGFDIAHEQSAGRLVIAYRRSGQDRVYFRTHDGSLSGQSSVDLGFSTPPDRVELVALTGSSDLLLLASGDNSLRAAVWDGSSFGDIQTIDGSFTGSTAAFDGAALPSGAGWMVGWARSTDSSLRIRSYESGSWASEQTGPSDGSAIGAVALASDPDGNELVTLSQRASNGRLRAAMYDGSSWSSTTTIDGNSTGGVFDVAYEGSGGGIVVVWGEDGDERLRYRRWNGSSWGSKTWTNTLDEGVADVLAVGLDQEPSVVLVSRTMIEASGGGGGGSWDPGDGSYATYAAYSREGSLDLGGVSVTGNTGSGGGGVSLPPNPGTSHGGSDKSYGNNQTVTLAPGNYGSLSPGNNVTLNLSAGVYRFKEFDYDKNGTTLNCDTSGGDVVFIVANGNFKAKNDFTITRSGSGIVVFQVSNGNFETKNNATIDALVVVHNGNLDMGSNTTVVGHLLAKSDITVGSGSVSIPSWSVFGGGGSDDEWRAWSLVIDEGSAGSPLELTTAAWTTGELPVAISERLGASALRLLRWRETTAFDSP